MIPEGIELTLSPAGLIPRFYAWLIDTVIRVAIYTGLIYTFKVFGSLGDGIVLISFFIIEWFYPIFFELLFHGQTPGKKVLGIYVAQENGAPVTPHASFIRNIIRFLDFLPFFYGFGIASMLLNRRFQRLGDLAANTLVLYLPKRKKVAKKLKKASSTVTLEKQEDLELTPLQPPYPLSADEQQVIMSFASRRDGLTTEQANELAQLTGTLVKDQEKPARYLSQLALWIAGKG